MSTRAWVQVAFVLAALTVAAPGHADDAEVAAAQPRFKEGLELAAASNFEAARLKFVQAFAVLKTPAVAYNLALTEHKTGHDVDAVEHYRFFLKTSANDARITDAMRERARTNVAELVKKLLQIDVDAPAGARIVIDDTALEERPTEPVAVAPGRHRVEATLRGIVKTVVVEGQVGQLVKAKLDFRTQADAQMPERRPSAPGRTTAGWVVPASLGVLGLGVVVVGAAMASASQTSKTDSESMRRASPGLCAPPAVPACASYDAKRDDAQSQATLAYVAYAAGGVLLAGAVASFVFWPRAEGSRTAVLVGPQGGTLRVSF